MEAERLEKLLMQLAEIVYSMDQDIADMRVSIAALKATAAGQLNPDDPATGLTYIHQLETAGREADPTVEKRKALGDVIDAIKLIQKHGSHET